MATSVCLFLDTDVNECDTSPCSQECANVYGSYQCYCRQGFQLEEDGHSCKGKAAALAGQVKYVCTLQQAGLSDSPQHLMLQVMRKDDYELHPATEAANWKMQFVFMPSTWGWNTLV